MRHSVSKKKLPTKCDYQINKIIFSRPTEGNVRANNFNFTTIHITAEGVGRSLDDVTDTAMPNTLVMNMLTLPRAYYNYQEDSVDK